MLEGEGKLISVEANCVKNKRMFKGKIIMTTYKISLIPNDHSILSLLSLSNNYFEVPLTMVAKYKFKYISIVQ